ncbi:acyl-CoA dehydrogenase family protein [Saccharothrix sp.]|uniref:acyl-CoA dehydrogenase family protein n=1 Tax=Saccharothrix sp. TaxID=1873460 RepID=UPI002811A58D|nr:acyl-CoA dehydrogenase family protein [Saccharothrix sp.]
MSTVEMPTPSALAERTAHIIPVLREHAVWGEEHRRLHDEVVDAMADAGVLKLRLPERFGGYAADARTTHSVLAELGKGDGSAAWVATVWAMGTWMMGFFPDETQEEVFSTPDVRIGGIISPTAMAVPVDGGVVVNGQWRFNSGALQSHWNTNAAVVARPDGTHEPVMLAVPMPDVEVIDDWHTTGLRASGSVTTVARDLFVPDHRVLPLGPVLAGVHPKQVGAASPAHRVPFMPVACATVGAPAIGLAEAALSLFLERLPGRKITYTDYEEQREAPITHLQLGEARTLADEAAFHLDRNAEIVDRKSVAGEQWTVEERARVRLGLGAGALRAKQAVELLKTASGGSSIYHDAPIQRVERDMHAMHLHAILHPNTNFELYGRVLSGLGPNTVYL